MDDSAAGAQLEKVKLWWDQLNATGPAYGYFPNGAKTWLVVKPHVEAKAQELFGSAAVNITVEGRPYLGGAVGESGFVTRFVQQKVSGWVAEVMKLSQVAVTQPHAAFAAFTHGISSKWTYLSRTIPGISTLLQPLEDVVREHLLSS